jgi:AcrR family transcriptional regulator
VAPLTFQRARTEENKRRRATALVEAARSLAVEAGVASVTLTAVAGRAGIHYSAVRRYFTSHKEVLLHLAAEGWVRWSGTVCERLAEPGPMSPSRVAETLANGLAADPLFCDLLANVHLHLEHEVDIDRVVEIRRTIAAAAIALADAIERALPVLGLLFDTLIVRSFMMPSVAALMGRWFWWPQKVRTRPASQMLRPYGPRSAVRAYMLPWDPTDPRGSRQRGSPNGETASTDRLPASAPHY